MYLFGAAILCACFVFSVARAAGPVASTKKHTARVTDTTIQANAGSDTTLYKNQTRPDSIFLNGATSTSGKVYHWDFISGPATPVIQSPDSITAWATGALVEGFYQFKLTVNGTVSDTMVAYLRDWQKRGIYPCRAGYDTVAKTGGLKITLDPNYKGTYIKSDGTTGTWNQWNFITDVSSYVQSTKKLTLSGGDMLLMEGADSTVWVELGGFGGGPGCPVYLMPHTKPVRIRGVNAFFRIAIRDSNVVQYVVVDGTALQNAGYPYGFLFDNSSLGYAGTSFTGGWVANFTLKGFHSNKTNAFKIKQDPTVRPFSRYDKWIQRNILISDNWVDSSSAEGMYIGSTAPDGGQTAYGWPIRMENVSIINNIVSNSTWDGIQLGNAKSGNAIKHNLVYKAGTANQPSQRAGILLGGNATGVVDSNIVVNAKGNGIQVFGYDAVNVYNNIVDSIYDGAGDQDGFYESFLAFASEPNNTPLSVFNYNNLISRIERNMIRVANNNGQMLPAHTHHNTFISPTATDPNSLIVTNVKGDAVDNNSIVANFPYTLNSISTKGASVNISVTQGDTTQTFSSVKATLNWLFGRLKSVTANVPPVVNAGADTTITLPLDSVRLTGSATDADGGSIIRYQWTKVSGPDSSVLAAPTTAQTWASNLVEGTYQFEFAATDNGNLTTRDTVQVTVLPLPNVLPTANAGSDQLISLPNNSITLSGAATDADGTIIKTRWTKVAGPVSYSIQDSTALQTTVNALQGGVYDFQLQVTDNRNGTGADTVRVVVNVPPSVNAGSDQIITLPTNSVTLPGKATDSDGTIASVQWTKLSGPSSYHFQDSSSATATVDGLVQGTYQFQLQATDNQGSSAADTMQVTVNSSSSVTTTKTININIYGGSNPYNNSAWNNWSLATKSASNVSSSAFKYSDGSASTVTATLSNSSGITDNGATYGSGMAPAAVLRYTSYYNNTRTLTLKGLSISKKYSIELYASRNVSGSSTLFTINGVSQTIATYKNLTNKAVFSNLTPNTSGQIVISISKSGSYNCINGFVITETTTTTSFVKNNATARATEETQESASVFELYPNPVADELALRLKNNHTGTAVVTIVNTPGRVVAYTLFNKTQVFASHSVSVSGLPAGVYFIQVEINGWHVSKEFVKL